MSTENFSRLKAFFPGGIEGLILKHFCLGEFAHDITYTVTNDTLNRKGKTVLSLHDGTTRRSPVIASIFKSQQEDYIERVKIAVAIPSCPSKTVVTMTIQHGLILNAPYPFTMKVGTTNQRHTERFEWRVSHGNEVRAIHQNAHGAKLVRLGREGPGGGQGGHRNARENGETSDGKEVVAVWGTYKQGLIPSALSPSKKPFVFYLSGSGKTGELGEEFPVVALMTALKIYTLRAQVNDFTYA